MISNSNSYQVQSNKKFHDNKFKKRIDTNMDKSNESINPQVMNTQDITKKSQLSNQDFRNLLS